MTAVALPSTRPAGLPDGDRPARDRVAGAIHARERDDAPRPDRRLPPRRPAAGRRAAGPRRPRAHRVGRRGRRLVGAADRRRAGRSTPTEVGVAVRQPARRPLRDERADLARIRGPAVRTGRLPGGHDARPGAGAMAPARRARRRGDRAGDRRLARRDGRARGRAGSAGGDRAHVAPIAAPAAIGPLAVAWNHLQVQLDRASRPRRAGAGPPAGDDDLPERGRLRRALRSARSRPTADRRSSATSTTRATSSSTGSTRRPTGSWSGRWTATTSGGRTAAWSARSHALGRGGRRADRDRDRGRHPVRAAPGPGAGRRGAAPPACAPGYREIRSTKGHDAFLVEWDQLTELPARDAGSG